MDPTQGGAGMYPQSPPSYPPQNQLQGMNPATSNGAPQMQTLGMSGVAIPPLSNLQLLQSGQSADAMKAQQLQQKAKQDMLLKTVGQGLQRQGAPQGQSAMGYGGGVAPQGQQGIFGPFNLGQSRPQFSGV